jgi:hypothetical protein
MLDLEQVRPWPERVEERLAQAERRIAALEQQIAPPWRGQKCSLCDQPAEWPGMGAGTYLCQDHWEAMTGHAFWRTIGELAGAVVDEET